MIPRPDLASTSTRSGATPSIQNRSMLMAETAMTSAPAAAISGNAARVASVAAAAHLVFFVSLSVGLSGNDGRFGPQVLIGWPNRLSAPTATGVWRIQ